MYIYYCDVHYIKSCQCQRIGAVKVYWSRALCILWFPSFSSFSRHTLHLYRMVCWKYKKRKKRWNHWGVRLFQWNSLTVINIDLLTIFILASKSSYGCQAVLVTMPNTNTAMACKTEFPKCNIIIVYVQNLQVLSYTLNDKERGRERRSVDMVLNDGLFFFLFLSKLKSNPNFEYNKKKQMTTSIG